MESIDSAHFAHIIGSAGPDTHALRRSLSTVTIHSNRIGSHAAFFALPGRRTDGHDFVGAALRNGASVVVVRADRALPADTDPARVLRVDDPLIALQRLAAWWRSRLRATVVAVVGANGKTTTKDALVHFAGRLGVVYGSPGSYNSQLGVALAMLHCPIDSDVAIIEAAGSQPGELEVLAEVIRPDRLIVTNLGARWSANFPGDDARARDLVSIARHLPQDGWILVGESRRQITAAATARCRDVLTLNESSRLPRFEEVRETGNGSIPFRVRFPGDERAKVLEFDTPSRDIVIDAQLAISAAYLLGVSAEEIVDAAVDYRPTSTRTEIWKSPRGVTIVRDVATADPIALTSAIRSAKIVAGGARRLSVVLSEPADSWPEGAESAIAQVLLDEGVKTVDALVHPTYRRLEGALRARSDVFMNLHENIDVLRASLLEQTAPGDVVLVQSPRERDLPDVSVALMESMAPTRLYIDLSAVGENVSRFRKLVGPSVMILAMVKALAYGTDAVAVSSALQDSGVDMLGVSNADEGIVLRRNGVHVPILVMLPMPADITKIVRHRLTPVVYSEEFLGELVAVSARQATPLSVHLEVDTGMHRTGLLVEEAIKALGELRAHPRLKVAGIMTHFAGADDPDLDHFTRLQIERFDRVLGAAGAMGYTGLIRHACATAGTLRFPDAHYDMVRLGIGLYGVPPSRASVAEFPLVPALSLRSRLINVLELSRGESVGYGATYTAPTFGRRIGVVPAGYHDCVPRAFSNHGYVVVGGVRCRIAGAVSMDSLSIDVSGSPQSEVGSEVLIYGSFDGNTVAIDEVAEAIGTIAYELMARVGGRVQRIFTWH